MTRLVVSGSPNRSNRRMSGITDEESRGIAMTGVPVRVLTTKQRNRNMMLDGHV
jgi:hypothetical protein